MAGGVTTMTIVDALLKEVFDSGGAYEQFRQGSILLSKLDKVKKATPTGKGYMVPVVTAPHSGIDVAEENEALIAAGSRAFAQAHFHLTSNYGRTSFTGQTIKQMESSESAVVTDIVTKEMSAMLNDMRADMNRKLNGCGYGILARWASGTDALPYTLRGRTRANHAYGFGGSFGTDYLKIGGRCQVHDFTTATSAVAQWSAADLLAGQGVITAIGGTATSPTATFTADPSFTEASGDFLTREKGMGTTSGASAESVPKEPYGLWNCYWDSYDDTIVDQAGAGFSNHHSFGNIVRATYKYWQGNIVGCGNYTTTLTSRWAGTPQSLSSRDLRKTLRIIKRACGELPDLILCTPEAFDAYGEYLIADKRWGAKDMTLDGGFESLLLNGIPLVADYDCHSGNMFFINLKYLKLLDLGGLRWMSFGNGDGVMSKVEGYDAVQATAVWYMNLICTRPQSGAILVGVDDYDVAS